MKNLQTLSAFLKFLKLYIFLDRKSHKIINNNVRDFSENCCADCCEFCDIFETIVCFEIQKANKKISKKSLQIMVYVHAKIICFSGADFCTPNLILICLLENVSQVAFVKKTTALITRDWKYLRISSRSTTEKSGKTTILHV